jgi:MFS family permease
VLRQRNFFLLWFAQLISRSGDWLLLIALPFYVYGLTNSAFAMGITFVAQMAPRVLLGSLIGVYVDRWKQKWVIVGADLARALLLLPILFVQSREAVWVIYVVVLLQSVLAQCYSPASSALLPRIVPHEQLLAANTASALARNLTQLIAPSLGGVLFELAGMRSVVLLDSATFVLSAVLTLAIVVPAHSEAASQANVPVSRTARRRLWHDWHSGIAHVARNQMLRAIFLALTISMFAQGLIDVLFVLYVKNVLQGTSFHWGLIESAQGIGGIIGGLIIGRVSRQLDQAQLVSLGLAGTGLFFLASISFPVLPLVILCTGLLGIPVVVFSVGIETALQMQADEGYLGRVFGLYGTVATSTIMAGMAAASLVGDYVDVTMLLRVAGVLYMLAALVIVQFWPTAYRQSPA